MKATLTREEYKDFTENVDKLKQLGNITVPHAVEFKGDLIEVSLLEDVNLNHLDNLLDKFKIEG
tara:strand:- start:861 stop:1052 length:192 start_codon:yes stop_codon:yes gene_type:complete